ncbi:MAG: sulfide/dihydroorotate dehydrogenase-like FAD/NAD-binding protein [Anaerolineaceae bacterium]|nr:sulfide/dihydroorotate dehydrogenase-like FAD/NAD-binding protein [Anaerolineaceae bacterium]
MFRILESKPLAQNMHMLRIEAPHVAASILPGQFVILRAKNEGERIPLSAADWDSKQGTLTVVFMVIGDTTRIMAALQSGDCIPTVVGPLGNPISIQNFGTVMCVGGCYGIGSLYPIMRALKQAENRIVMVIEARSAHLYFWESKLNSMADELHFITRDGSRGYRGHVKDQLPTIIKNQSGKIDRMIINGCNYVMKRACRVSKDLGIKTLVSLNTIMIDGTGMCGVCRLTVGGEMKFACVDGPYFDGHLVDWNELALRRRMYLREEALPLRSSASEPRVI